MRPVREVTAEEENFRLEPRNGWGIIKRDPVEPEPIGTVILMAFRITGYGQDCDGSLLPKLECINKEGEATGWRPDNIGLYPDCDLVVDEKEWKELFEKEDCK